MYNHVNSISFSIHRLSALQKTVLLNISRLEVQLYSKTITPETLKADTLEIISMKRLLTSVIKLLSELVADGKHTVQDVLKNKKMVEFTESYLEIFLLQDARMSKELMPGETLLVLWFRQSK